MISYTWNLTDLYKTNDEFLADFELAKKYLKNAKKSRGKLNKNDKKTILEYFKLDEEMSVILEKLAVYAFCKQDDDAKNEDNIKNYASTSDFFSKISEELAFVKTELSSLSVEFLTEMKNDKEFKDFDRFLEDIIRQKAHTLSEKEEQNMAIISGFNNTDDIFSVLSNIEMNHGEVEDDDGNMVKLMPGNYGAMMNNADSIKRDSPQHHITANR